MSERPSGQFDRRAYPRVEVSAPIELEAVPGATAKGVAVNLSRGGLLGVVDRRVSVGDQCTVRFPKARGINPEVRSATVRRCAATNYGFEVTIEFMKLRWLCPLDLQAEWVDGRWRRSATAN